MEKKDDTDKYIRRGIVKPHKNVFTLEQRKHRNLLNIFFIKQRGPFKTLDMWKDHSKLCHLLKQFWMCLSFLEKSKLSLDSTFPLT